MSERIALGAYIDLKLEQNNVVNHVRNCDLLKKSNISSHREWIAF